MESDQSPLVDFHCHLDLYPDFAAAVQRCEEAGIYTLTVTTTPRAWEHNHAVTSPMRYVRAALGLHPQLVEGHAHEIDLFEKLLPQTRYIGEVGLDAGPQFFRSLPLQQTVFRKIISLCAAAGDKILTVHSVRAVGQVLDIIERESAQDQMKVILHWFTGTPSELRRAIELGCFFSVNAQMTKCSKRLALVRSIPMERVLTETDGPFTQAAGKVSEPADVIDALAGLAKAHALSVQDIRCQIAWNLRKMLVPN